MNMKKIILSVTAGLISAFSVAQTATNFNCTDCAAANHDLFTELDAGKVIVICWVMPCSNCINGALSSQSAVQSFSNSNPGQVFFYCSDDYANSTCSTINGWCSTNGITNATKFSNAAVSMSGYGAAGMPKVVVLGSATHSVYFNQNGAAITQSGITSAINAALVANATGVKENENNTFASASIFPNPSNTSCSLSFNLSKDSKVKVEMQNILGQKVAEVFNGDLQKGENTLNVSTSELSNGNYFINFSDGNGNSTKNLKLIIIR
jgi:hypothetical protein